MHLSTRFLAAMAAAALLSRPTPALAQAVGPDLVIAMTHSGNFTVGENGIYTIVVSNIGTTASSGQIGVFYAAFELGKPFSFVSATGTGWSCSLHFGIPNTALECFSSSAIPPEGSAPPITLTVNPCCSGTWTNSADLEGGSNPVASGGASDVTIVVAAVPTVPQWALIALTACLALAGVVALRQRTR
jgi:hypothetical protein